MKKTAFQRAKDAEAERQARSDAELANAYSHFLASFDTSTAPPVEAGSVFVRASAAPSDASQLWGAPEARAAVAQMHQQQQLHQTLPVDQALARFRSEQAASNVPSSMAERRRNLEAGLALMKERSRDTPAGASNGASADAVDAITAPAASTNIYIGGLDVDTNEADVCRDFGQFGPIASVKAFVHNGQLRAFVAYMLREHAEKALTTMNGSVLRGCKISVGWSRAVGLPREPIYVAGDRISADLLRLASAAVARGEVAVVRVLPPASVAVLDAIHSYLSRDSEAFAAARDPDNPLFAFLHEENSSDHRYFLWKRWSLSHGSTMSDWKDAATLVEFDESGAVWYPPPKFALEARPEALQLVLTRLHEEAQSGFEVRALSSAAAVSSAAVASLSAADADCFVRLVQRVTLSRASIEAAMGFALDRSEAAEELVTILVASLTQPPCATLAPLKVARLYLLSDILHNSSSAVVPRAARFRSAIEPELRGIFASLGATYESIQSRLRATAMRERVEAVLRAWTDWCVFAEPLLAACRAAFLGKVALALRARVDAFRGESRLARAVQAQPPSEDIDGEPLTPVRGLTAVGGGASGDGGGASGDGRGASGDGGGDNQDVDGVPLDVGTNRVERVDDIDGIPLA